jgi:hypothetical protein
MKIKVEIILASCQALTLELGVNAFIPNSRGLLQAVDCFI